MACAVRSRNYRGALLPRSLGDRPVQNYSNVAQNNGTGAVRDGQTMTWAYSRECQGEQAGESGGPGWGMPALSC